MCASQMVFCLLRGTAFIDITLQIGYSGPIRVLPERTRVRHPVKDVSRRRRHGDLET
jgi:hypothetical protein